MDPNKYIKYQAYQMTDFVRGGGLFSPEQCKQLSEKLMMIYDENQDGQLDLLDVSQMHQDCYRAMNKSYNPTPTDIAAFSRKMDTNGRGRIDQVMLEQLCLKNLSSNVSNNDLNSQIIQPLQEIKSEIISIPPPQQQEIQLESANVESDQLCENNYLLVQPSPLDKKVESPPPKIEEQKQAPPPPPPEKKEQPVTPPSKPIIRPSPQKQPEVKPPSPPKQAPQPQPQPQEKHYTKQVEDRLKVARRIFTVIDFDKSGYITEQEVPKLLIETYKLMGMALEPTQEDVDLWMEMADLDKDGKVYLRDYEDLILRGLKNQGIQLE